MKALLALVGGITIVGTLAQPPAAPAPSAEAPLLPRAEFLHALGASVQPMVADFYWLEAIQALGLAHNAKTYRDVYFYVDLATDLDPQFYDAYTFGAVSVTYNLGHWNWVNTAESSQLIRKGLQFFPRDAPLLFLLSYNLMYYDHQFKEAADIVKDLSQRRNAPSFLAPLATRLYAQGGSFEAATAFAEAMRDSAKDDATRDLFEERVKQIKLEKILQEIDRASSSFKEKNGRLARSIEELQAQGFLGELPPDPLEGTLELGADGRGESTAETHRLEVYGAESSLPSP